MAISKLISMFQGEYSARWRLTQSTRRKRTLAGVPPASGLAGDDG